MQAVLSRNSTYEDSVRWARCLSEIVKQAGQLCNESAKAAYVEVSSRLQVSKLVLLKPLPLCSLSTNVLWEDARRISALMPANAATNAMQAVCALHACSQSTAAAYPESR